MDREQERVDQTFPVDIGESEDILGNVGEFYLVFFELLVG